MAKPRVFISSTFFDLRQVRADLERFIKELGYESVRNETGSIPYGKDEKLEDYCYKEISEIDILVGIVGGRFGQEASAGDYSITQTEIKTAINQNKQIYVFVEKNVLSEYQTYLINKTNKKMKYRFADDKRIYKFIEEIYSLPKNNIIHPFETAQDIISFLKEQWAGVFRDLLIQQTRKSQFENVSHKVNELTEVASTLKTYLENVLQNVSKEKSQATSLISKETGRLKKFQLQQDLMSIDYMDHLAREHGFTPEEIVDGLKSSNSISELKLNLNKNKSGFMNRYSNPLSCMDTEEHINNVNQARALLGLRPFVLSQTEKIRVASNPLSKLRKSNLTLSQIPTKGKKRPKN